MTAAGTSAVAAAKQATSTIPIVFMNLSNPIRTGIVQSLARPGGNLTGTTSDNPELAGKRLSLLQELLPDLSSVAFMRNPDNPAWDIDIAELQAAAQHLHLQVVVVDAFLPSDVEPALVAAAASGAGALLVTNDPVHSAYWQLIGQLAERQNLPVMSYSSTAAATHPARLVWTSARRHLSPRRIRSFALAST